MQSAAIPVDGVVVIPGVQFVADRWSRVTDLTSHMPRAVGEDCLHVTPTEKWVGLQHQGDHAADHRRCGRGAVERSVVELAGWNGVTRRVVPEFAHPVGCDDLIETQQAWSRRRADQQVGAGGGVGRHEASIEDGADGDGMAADVGHLLVCVAENLIVHIQSFIAGGLEDDRAKASSSVLGGVFKRDVVGLSFEGAAGSPAVVGDVEIGQGVQELVEVGPDTGALRILTVPNFAPNAIRPRPDRCWCSLQ